MRNHKEPEEMEQVNLVETEEIFWRKCNIPERDVLLGEIFRNIQGRVKLKRRWVELRNNSTPSAPPVWSIVTTDFTVIGFCLSLKPPGGFDLQTNLPLRPAISELRQGSTPHYHLHLPVTASHKIWCTLCFRCGLKSCKRLWRTFYRFEDSEDLVLMRAREH